MWYFMCIEIDNILVNVEIVRKNNKNTYMRVKNGVLVVTTNYMVSDRKIKEIIINNKDSIIKMLEKDNKLNEKNNYFYLFGKKYDVVYGSFNEIDITCDKIYVKNEKELNKYLTNNNLSLWKNIATIKILQTYAEYTTENYETIFTKLNKNLLGKEYTREETAYDLIKQIYPNEISKNYNNKYLPKNQVLRQKVEKPFIILHYKKASKSPNP